MLLPRCRACEGEGKCSWRSTFTATGILLSSCAVSPCLGGPGRWLPPSLVGGPILGVLPGVRSFFRKPNMIAVHACISTGYEHFFGVATVFLSWLAGNSAGEKDQAACTGTLPSAGLEYNVKYTNDERRVIPAFFLSILYSGSPLRNEEPQQSPGTTAPNWCWLLNSL